MPDTPVVERLPLDDLVPAPSNVKAHDRDLIVASLRRFGFADPVVVDQRTGELLAGHGRVEALQAMRDGGEDAPAGADGWRVPVYTGWASADDTEADAARVALNRTTEAGGWDDTPLLELLDRLNEVDGLEGVGYDEDEIEKLRRQLDAASASPLDAYAEWDDGMPDYDQPDLQSAHRVIIHFPTDEDADRFFKLLDRPKRKSMWWPESDGHVGCHYNTEVVAPGEAAADA